MPRSETRDVWRPQAYFSHELGSRRALDQLNAGGGIAVDFQAPKESTPHLSVEGGQSRTMSLWLTRSSSGFLSTPKIAADLFTIRFVTGGRMIRRDRGEEHVGLPGCAMFVAFEDMRDEEASAHFTAVSGTITRAALARSHAALEGRPVGPVPELEPVAPVTTLAMQSFMLCFQHLHRRLGQVEPGDDLFFPLLEEIVSYQLLSSWPRRDLDRDAPHHRSSSAQVRRAVDYIDAHLAQPLRLADIAAAVGVSVRTLQLSFKRERGITPVAFILERRMERVYWDLRDVASIELPIATIARRWGFVHMSDFTQRYRKRFGCTPRETRDS